MSAADVISRFAGKAKDATDTAANKAQSHLDDAKDLVDDAGPTLDKASRRAQAIASQGLDAAGKAAKQFRDGVSEFTDGAVAYTKKNPIQAVVIAAASGALMFGLYKAFTAARD